MKGTDVVLIVGGDWKGVTPPAGAAGPSASGQAASGKASTTTAPPTTATAAAPAGSAPKPAGGPAQPSC